MAPSNGMLRYNTDNKYFEWSTDGGGTWTQLDLTGATNITFPTPSAGAVGPTIQNVTSTGTVANLTINSGRWILLTLNNASLLTIQGFSKSDKQHGDIIEAIQVSGSETDFPYNSGSATAGNRLINFVSSGVTPINRPSGLSSGGGSVKYIYDSSATAWRLVSHEQGNHIAYTPTVTAVGGGSLTAGAMRNASYTLRGKLLFLYWAADMIPSGTVTSATVTFPNSYTSNQTQYAPMTITTGSAATQGRVTATAGNSNASFDMIDASGAVKAFAGGVNSFLGQPWFEVN